MHHVIVQSEGAVRSRNSQLEAENRQLRDEVDRLRALVGEAPLPQALTSSSAVAPVRSFQAGECKVTIGVAGPPRLNPGVAPRPVVQAAVPQVQAAAAPSPSPAAASAAHVARVAVRAPAPPRTPAPIIPVARPMAPGELAEISDEDLEGARFRLIELR